MCLEFYEHFLIKRLNSILSKFVCEQIDKKNQTTIIQMECFMQFFSTKMKSFVAVFLLAFLSFAAYTFSSSDGSQTGLYASGCSCHGGGSSNSATSLSVTSGSGSFSVKPNSTTNFTVKVSNSSGLQHFGTNIAVVNSSGSKVGTVSAGTGLQVRNGELTHSGKQSNGTSSFDFTFSWTAPATAGKYYIKAVGNAVNNNNGTDGGDQWNLLSEKEIIVTGLTTTAPTGGNYCPGGNVNIAWTNLGATNVKIELSSDGGQSWPTVIAASVAAGNPNGTYVWTTPTNIAPGSNYMIKVSDVADATTSSVAPGAITIIGPPSITTQPKDVTTCENNTASFSIAVAGQGLQYQWRKGGQNITGANSATYNINSVSTDQAGSYDCVVTTSSCSYSLTSNAVTLTVKPLATVTQQPAAQTACTGGTVTFTAAVSGNNSYKWQKNGAFIADATTNTLTLNNVTIADTGSYRMVAINTDCSSTIFTSYAKLSINVSPKIVSEPNDLLICQGNPINLSVVAEGTNLTYQWKKNGVDLPNETKASFTKAVSTLSDSGSYELVVSGTCTPTANSKKIKVAFTPAPVVVSNPASQTAKVGNTVTFAVETAGDAKVFQWYKDNVILSGKNGKNLILQDVKLTDAGKYKCIIENSCAKDTSEEATLTVVDGKVGPILTLALQTVDFDQVELGKQKDSTFVALIKNTGDEQLKITDITIDDKSPNLKDFRSLSQALPYLIDAGKSLDVIIQFKPEAKGAREAVLKFLNNSPTEVYKINLYGFGKDVSSVEDEQLKASISVSPNPSANEINLVFNSNQESEFTFNLYSSNGNLVNSFKANAISGNNQLSFNVQNNDGSSLASGKYIGVLHLKNSSASFPIVISK